MRAPAQLHHCTSIIIRPKSGSKLQIYLHMLRLVEIALPPGLMDHLTSQLLPRMLWADAGDTHAAVWCGHTRGRGYEAAVRWKKKEQKKEWNTVNVKLCSFNISACVYNAAACLCPCYRSMAALVMLVASVARCSGSALCWGPELWEQVEAAPLVGLLGQLARKQMGRSFLLHLRIQEKRICCYRIYLNAGLIF